MTSEAKLDRIAEAAANLENEAEIVGLVGEALSATVQRCMVRAYTIHCLRGSGFGIARHFLAARELPDSPECQAVFFGSFFPVIRRVAGDLRGWVEAVRDGVLSKSELGRAFQAHGVTLDVKEWGFFVAALGREPLGGANLLLPSRARPFSQAERERLGALVPKLSSALRLATLLASAPAGLYAVEHLLSSRADSVLLLSSSGRMLGASKPGERMLLRHPRLRESLARLARRSPQRPLDVYYEEFGVDVHLNPCSPRGGAAAVLFLLGTRNPDGRGRLTARQAELLDLLREGLTNAQIASRMGLAPTTVKTMLQKLYRFSGSSGRVRVLEWAAGRRAS